ncbi:MAG: hypothetical protein Kow0056_05390 [Coriobacteriia bacterium]
MGRTPCPGRLLGALAVTAAVMLVAAAVALAATRYTGEYEHVWAVQGQVGGDLGGRMVSDVVLSEAELESEAGSWTGSIRYEDKIGVESPSGAVTAQWTEIRLDLTGEDVEPAKSAGGTFTGRVRVRRYDVARPEDALGALPEGGEVSDVEYEVSGHWGGVIDGDTVRGEILYESADVVSAQRPDGIAGPADLNRLSLAHPDSLGDAQTFTVEAGGVLPAPGDGEPGPGDDGSGGGAGGGAGPQPTEGFWDFVAQGLRGDEREVMSASPEQTAVARRLLDATPIGATPLPEDAVAIDVHLSGAYLDAKNRAAGLLGDDGPTDAAVPDGLVEAWEAGRQETVQPVAPGSEDRLTYYGQRVLDALDRIAEVRELGGARGLRSDIEALLARGPSESGDDPAPEVKLWSHAVEALTPGTGAAWVGAGSRTACRTVLDTPIPQEGPLADAILAWADRADAPAGSVDTARFERDASLDATATVGGDSLVAKVLARFGTDEVPPALSVPDATGTDRLVLQPDVWTAHVSPDGRVFWLAGTSGPYALADGSLRGWAFDIERAWLVDAGRIGRVRTVFGLE